ncbi:redoxin domain-containing protein [Actinomadura geliboluensis]|uniref:Redoxin domain-containing protein n=1 Tax=Actinomadura geliboluensis TaxID=882440 RepID=A0A5S4HAE6_9ACTN|nr:redoxin domain-containing protein [Actinomadura geliboluensis]TMR41704.1 redoxin domain-containing protein [Actinomadura geliboluensis]
MSFVPPSVDEAASSAPPWATTQWFNSDPLNLTDMRGRVVVLEAFQMLCPGCVGHALPQAVRLAQTFGDDLAVIGLHSVFEHHDAMTPTSLRAFLHEYKIHFPVAVDAHRGEDPTPVTFARYRMRGTPTTVLIDRDGNLRGQQFGALDDMTIAAAVARLIDEGRAPRNAEASVTPTSVCVPGGDCT